jgi:hypothetical protein
MKRIVFPSLRLPLLLGAAALVTLAACGEGDKKSKACVLTYDKESETFQGESKLVVTYRSVMTSECKAVYSENSGRSNVSLAITAKGGEGMYVDALKVGDKSFAFGEKYSLANGNFQRSFSSDLADSWAFPWVDQPSTASVTVVMARDEDKANWPTVVTTEFAADSD